jgi:hypothetical protein
MATGTRFFRSYEDARMVLPTGRDEVERAPLADWLSTTLSAAGDTVGTQTVVFPALSITPDAESGPTPVSIKYGDVMVNGHRFATSGALQYAHWYIPMPLSWNPAADMDFAVHWTAQDGVEGVGGVVFSAQCFVVSDGETIGGFYSNERSVTDTLLSPYDWHTSAFSAGFRDTTAQTGDTIFMRVWRATGNVADTLDQPAILTAVTVRYRVKSGTDD